MTANQNFRVGISLDLSQARRQFRKLEEEFADLTFDIGGLRNADRHFKDLGKSVRGIADDIRKIERALRDLDKSADKADDGITKAVRALNRLVEETKDSRKQLRLVGKDMQQVANDFRDLAKAARVLDRAFESLNADKLENDMNQLARGVENLREKFASSDDDARRLGNEIRDLADATRALDRANDAANRSQGRLNGELRRKVNRAGPGNIGGFVGVGGGGGFLGLGGSGLGFAGVAGGIALISQLGEVFLEATRRAGEFLFTTGQIASEFDLLIRRADVLAGGGGITGFTDAALAQGRRTIFTAREAANSLGELARAGFDVEESIAALPGVLDLAASDQVDLEKATLITARTLRAFRIDAKDAGIVADILAETAAASATNVLELGQGLKFVSPIAATLGESLQSTAAAMGILGDRGFVAGIAGRALRRTLSVLADPSEKAAEALDKLGIQAFDVEGRFVGLESIAQQLAKAEEDIGNQGEYVGTVFAAFGLRSAPQLIALADAADEFGERIDDNFRSFGRAAEIAQLQLAGLEGSLIRLRSAFESEQINSFLTSGLEQQFGGFVDDIRSLLPDLFAGVVNPAFDEIAIGVNRIRSETLPDVIDAFEPVGDIISETLQQIFDFIIENDDDIIAASLGVANAVQAILDTFIGLGEVALPILGLIAKALDALPDTVPSALTGGAVGAGIGGLIGLVGGPGGAAVGAGVGAVAGGTFGIIGNLLRDRQSLERTLAEFGVDLGLALSQGFADGLTVSDAIKNAFESVPQFTGTGIDSFDKLRELANDSTVAFEDSKKELDALKATYDELVAAQPPAQGLGLINSKEVDDVAEAIGRAESRVRELGKTAQFYEGSLSKFLATEEVTRLVESEIARAQAFIDQLTTLGGPADRFRVETDPEAVIENLVAGKSAIEEVLPFYANDVPLTIEEAGNLTEKAFASWQADAASGLAQVVGELDAGTVRILDALTGLRDNIEGLSQGLGVGLFEDVSNFSSSVEGALSLDFSAIFDAENADGEPIEVSAATAKKELAALLTEIPTEAAAEAQANVDRIFADTDLSLADQILGAATVVDQAVLAQRAEDLAAQITSVFEIAQAKLREADALEATPTLNISRFLPEDDRAALAEVNAATAEQAQALRDQAGLLLTFQANGDYALATLASTSDAVLSALTENATALEAQKEILNSFGEDVEVEVGITLGQDSVQAVINQISDVLSSDELAEGAEAGAAGVGDAFTDVLGEVPDAIRDIFETNSPSKLMERIGRWLVEGFDIGWSNAFPAVRTAILSDLAALVTSMEATLNRLNIKPTVNVNAPGSTGGRPVFHSGGLIPGQGDLPILAQGGEYMLRRGAAEYLSRVGLNLDQLNRAPQTVFPDPIARTQSTVYDRSQVVTHSNATTHEHHYTIQAGGGKINTKRLARDIQREFVKGVK